MIELGEDMEMLKKLPIEKQVEFINNEIKKGTSIQVIASKYYGIKTESGLRKKLNKLGYHRNGTGTPFVKNDDFNNKTIIEDNKSKKTTLKGDKEVTEVNLPILNLRNNNDFIEVIERLEILEYKFNKIGCEKGVDVHPTNQIEETTLKTYISPNKVIKKSIFLYPEVWDMLDQVTALFPQSTKQTVYNNLLVEVLEKYLNLYKNNN